MGNLDVGWLLHSKKGEHRRWRGVLILRLVRSHCGGHKYLDRQTGLDRG